MSVRNIFVIIRDCIIHFYWGKVRSAPIFHGGDDSTVFSVVFAILHSAFLGSSTLIVLVV